MSKKLLLFILFLMMRIPQSISDELDDFLGDAQSYNPELTILDNKATADFETVDTLIHEEQNFEKRKYRKNQNSIARASWAPKIFTALVQVGSKLIDVKTNKVLKVKRAFYARAREKVVGSQISYILDQKGKIRYRTSTWNLADIESDIKLLPKISALEIYEGKQSFHSIDKSLPLSHFLSYHFETITTNYYPMLFRGNSKSALAYRLQFKSYYRSHSPLNFGLNLQYNFGYWEDTKVGLLTWKALFIGPTTHLSFWENNNSSWHLHFGIGQSLFHHSEKKPDKHKLSSTAILLDIERASHTRYGKFLIGGGLRWTKSAVKETTELIINNAQKGNTISISFAIGYLYDWSL